MTKLIVGFFSFFLFFLSLSTAQPLWHMDLGIETFMAVENDTTIGNLRQILASEDEHKNVPAGMILAYYHGDSQKDFIITQLSEPAPINKHTWFDWVHYFGCQQIRGYLGDSGAIACMDTVALFALDDERLEAVCLLAEAGRLDYFDLIKSSFFPAGGRLHERAVDALGFYGQDSRFRADAANLLAAIIRDSTDVLRISGAWRSLVKFDKPMAVELLNQRFVSSQGKLRYNFFFDLRNIDRDGQPERAMFAVPLEPDEDIRERYFPFARNIFVGVDSKRYFEPRFVRFARQWRDGESSVEVRMQTGWFLKDFLPFRPGEDFSVLAMIDSLSALTDTMSTYGWVGNQNFAAELKDNLQAAKTDLTAGDTSSCSGKVRAFQSKVDEEYRDSLDGDTRSVSREGWKFLFYNAQYVVDRLSETR